GVTVGSNGVKVGPLNPMAASPCDELNPQCNGKAPNPSTEKSNDAGVMERLKTYHPGPNPDVVWRRSFVDPDPLSFGFAPEKPTATYSPGKHVLNEQGGKGGSQYISASRKPGGAINIEGDPYAISVPKAQEAGVKFHSTEDIIRDLERMTLENPKDYP